MNSSPFCLTCGKAKGRPQCALCGVGAPGLMPEKDPFALAPGVVLKGQYEIGRILGRGGFGITYLAIDQNLGMPVAIKEHRILPTDERVRHLVRKPFRAHVCAYTCCFHVRVRACGSAPSGLHVTRNPLLQYEIYEPGSSRL